VPDVAALLAGDTRSGAASAGTFSTKDYANAHGVSRHHATQLVSRAIDAGALVYAGSERRMNMAGRLSIVPVYRVAGE